MQVKFNDGTTLEVLAVNGKSVYVQGTQRDALEIQMAKTTTTLDALDTLTADTAKTRKLTLIDGDNQYVHDNYCIRAELAIKPVITAQATSTTPEVTEDRLCVTLAQPTYSEVQMAAQQAQIDALTSMVIAQ